jgi:hypothetical protein
MERKLEVDVHAHWNNNPPVYRLYVNDEMLTERTFGWVSYQFYITEHMYCDLETGVHTLRLENLDSESRFELLNFKVDNQLVNKNLLRANGSKIEWRFIADNLINNRSIDFPKIDLTKISTPMPLAPPPQRPRVQIQQKKYETALPLVQKMRMLNKQASKK